MSPRPTWREMQAATEGDTRARRARNAKRGAVARTAGERLEAQLERMHAGYRRQGLADVAKLPTPAQVMGKTRRDHRGRTLFPACWAARTGADFEGVLGDLVVEDGPRAGESFAGRAIRFESKSRATPASGCARLALGDIKAHQREALRRCRELGGVAFVVVRLDDVTWAVADHHIVESEAAGRKTWTAENLDERGVRLRGVDWLAALVSGDLWSGPAHEGICR